jgi:hypothetical protein
MTLVAACGTIDDIITSNARVDYKQGYDFDRIERVSVACGMDVDSAEFPLSLAATQRVNSALARALESHGISVVNDAADADAQVTWHVVTEERQRIREYNAQAYYQCWRCGPAISSASEITYTMGTFIVDIIDPALRKSVWRGVMQGRLAEVGNADLQQRRFDKAARQMLAKFPPGLLIDGVF